MSTPATHPIMLPSDVKRFTGTALAMCLFAHWRRAEMRKRHLPGNYPDEKLSIVDHPAFAYLMENGACFSLAYLVAKYSPVFDKQNILKTYLLLLVYLTCMVDPLLVLEKFLARRVYAHVPYFSERSPPQDWQTQLKDYLSVNLPVTLVSGVILIAAGFIAREHNFPNMFGDSPQPVRFFPYLGKFLYSRLLVDVVFGYAHKAMHENKWLYQNVHRVHHEHQTPRTQTNYHFSFLDQYIEASFPVYFAMASLMYLGFPPSRYEQPFLVIPLLYFETSSHAGKELPTVTWFPVLSPLVNYVTGGCDQRLIEYHTRHHQLFRCNYSISPWLDKLWWGTYRIDLPDYYNNNNATKAEDEDDK